MVGGLKNSEMVLARLLFFAAVVPKSKNRKLSSTSPVSTIFEDARGTLYQSARICQFDK
jgi:hypothetical protein